VTRPYRPYRPNLAPARVAAALVPISLLAAAAIVPAARIPLLIALVVGFVVSWRLDRLVASAWAGAIPVAVSLAWGLSELPATATDGSTCTDPLAPFATYRLVDAVLAIAALAVLAPLVAATTAELGLRRPGSRILAVGTVGAIVVGPLALAIGPALSEPWFGPLPVRTGELGAIGPALVFAVSNGVMEELVYRGALQAWLARRTGVGIAIAAQAIVFGLAHGASQDFVTSPLPVVALMIAGGVIAGIAVVRTGTLALPIMLHVAFDVPLYYGNACLAP
jgi:hypothetical protein